jgi:uncharacterized protein with FMN-binding domain
VAVSEGRITWVDILRHEHGRGEAAEAITAHIVDGQTLAVDVISGASLSSKMILKAVEDALAP